MKAPALSWVSIACAVGAIGLALGSIALPWFRVPLSFGPDDSITSGQPGVTNLFRALVLLGITGALAFQYLTCLRRAAQMALLTGLVAAVFPTATLHTASVLCGQAAWLQSQHRGIVWLGGDIPTSQDARGATDPMRLYFVDAPRTMAAVSLPRSIPYLFQVGRFYDILGWLGYTDWFCQFAGRGWKMALGASALMLGSVLLRRRQSTERISPGLARGGLAAGGVLALVAAAPVGVAAAFLQWSQLAATRGNAADSAYWLEAACRAFPILREDSQICQQQGALDTELHRESPAARLSLALRGEKLSRGVESKSAYLELWTDLSAPNSLRREAWRGLSRIALNRYNSGMREEATELLEKARATQDWVSPKILYADCARIGFTGDPEEGLRALARINRCYTYFNEPTAEPVRAAVLNLLHLNPAIAIP